MMKFKSINLNLFYSFLLCCLLSSCFTYKAVEIKEIKSVRLLNNDITSGKMEVNLRVANPNNYAIKVKKYDLHAFVNNSDLGRIDVADKIVISKNSDQDYKIIFSADMSKILSEIPNILFKGSAEAALRGQVRIKALFLSKKFSVDLKKKVSASDLR